MKKHSRIEITAFRRRTTVIFRDEPRAAAEDVNEVHFDDQVIPVEGLGSPELQMLVEALVKSDGDSARAAEHLGLSRSGFYSRLRGLGLSIKHIKDRLESLRGQHGSNRRRSDYKCSE